MGGYIYDSFWSSFVLEYASECIDTVNNVQTNIVDSHSPNGQTPPAHDETESLYHIRFYFQNPVEDVDMLHT